MRGTRLDGHPHGGEPALAAGVPLDQAAGAMILIHGRGSSARDILTLQRELECDTLALVAPQAAGSTWYPQSFMAPIAANEPYLSSAVRRIHEIVEGLGTRGLTAERLILLGFSQGACLAVEYAVRHPRRFGGVVGLSGGLIGPPGTIWNGTGRLDQSPVFLGCSDQDPHIPLERVRESTAHLTAMGARVDERIYGGMGHTISRDEFDAVQEIIDRLPALPTGK